MSKGKSPPAKKLSLSERMKNRTKDLDAAVDKQTKGSKKAQPKGRKKP